MDGLVRPQVPAAGVKGPEGKGVVLVVAHHGEGRAAVHHAAHQLQCFPDGRAPVNKVPHEYHLPAPGVAVHALGIGGVLKLLQQLPQLRRVAVDVADEVVHGRGKRDKEQQ